MISKNVIGIMSGTSLDGIDIVLCHFQFDKNWSFQILKAKTVPYPDIWIKKLSEATQLSATDLIMLDKSYGKYIGELINDFIADIDVNIDLIASHGHTVFHQPENKYTLQIGDGASIASSTGTTTVSDFRSLDVALGGQGAPLVPIGDQLLFPQYDYCINIGGFSNISFQKNDHRKAYDICPANIILNHLSAKKGQAFDKNGEIGKKGQINKELLHQLNDIAYYKLASPKSLGKEWLDKEFTPIIEVQSISLHDKMRTVYEHIAHQIANTIQKSNASVLITGGGAHNTFLIDLIKEKSVAKIVIPDETLIDYKEALIFGLLGILRYNKQTNCLCSVTGAQRDSSSGIVHLA